MNLAPIVLFVYNRPEHTQQTLEALSNNDLADQSILYIYADGPKENVTNEDLEKIREVETIVNSSNWCGKQEFIPREKNWGLANSIIDGVTKIVTKYGKTIVLEDDLVTSPYFLKFMNEGLEMYEYNNEVASIHGWTYPIDDLPDTFFIRGADCWGWATWKKGWDLFEHNGHVLLKKLLRGNLSQSFDFNWAYPFTNMLKKQVGGKVDSWAIRWYASAFLNDKLTLYPGKSLVRNIGNDNRGTHMKKTNVFDTIASNKEINMNKIQIQQSEYAFREFEKFLISIQVPRCKNEHSKLSQVLSAFKHAFKTFFP